jgi:asparaginyl-tRNA synthetase
MSDHHYITVKEAIAKGEGTASLRGWVYRERESNKFKFIVLRDGTDIIQCVVKKDEVPAHVWEDAVKLQVEASIKITGTLRRDERAPTGVELTVTALSVVGGSHEFPIGKDQSTEFLLDHRHLWMRSRYMNAILKIKAKVMQAWREYYDTRGYIEFTPPIFQPNQSEGGATLFEVKYYKTKTFLTQSWQLYGESAIFSYERLYCISPCFRAETSKTSRHLSEFWMAEMEAAWCQLPELLNHIEGCLKHIVARVLEDCADELKVLNRDVAKLRPAVEKPFPRMTYTEALDVLEKKSGMAVDWGKDLRTVEEEELLKHYDTPVMVTNYPKEIMAFYKPADPADPKTALCVDVLAPEGYGEIVGGSQRDLDIEKMSELLREMGEDPEHYRWYFDLRTWGSVPHSGYGMGVERVVSWICGLENIKDAIPYPRTQLRWTP